jgi:glycosyltransferase involved in cell wall biosynthesis
VSWIRRGEPGLQNLEARLSRAQEEIRDLGTELLETHERLDEILRHLERGSFPSVPSETIVEERLRSLDARLRLLSEIHGQKPESFSWKLIGLLARTSGPLRQAGKDVARRAWRRVRLARHSYLPDTEWMFDSVLVRRPALDLPAVGVVVEGGPEEFEAAATWTRAQSLGGIRIAALDRSSGTLLKATLPGEDPYRQTVGPDNDWLRRLDCRWAFRLPLPAPVVSPTFLELHLWAAATEDLLFTAAASAGDLLLVLRRLDFDGEAARPASNEEGSSAVVGRMLPFPFSRSSAASASDAELLLRKFVSIGGRWVTRRSYPRVPRFVSGLTPLDSLFPRKAAPPPLSGPAEIVALVPTLSGAGPAGFVRRLAQILEPRRRVQIVSLERRDSIVDPDPREGPAFSYPAGVILDPVLHLSVIEHLALGSSRSIVLDFTRSETDANLVRSLRLRNSTLSILDVRSGEVEGRPGTRIPAVLPPRAIGGADQPSRREMARNRLGIPDGVTAVLLLDVLDEDARAVEFLQVALELERQGGWFFVVAGDGPLLKFLKERISSTRLTCATVLPASALPEDDLAAADVLCAIGGPPGNANVLLQALALGVPSVVPAGTARALGLEDSVLALDGPVSVESLVVALQSLRSPEVRDRLSEKAAAGARSFYQGLDLVRGWRELADRHDGDGA